MSVCNLHANCNLIVKSTISRQAKGYSTYMRYRGQVCLEFICNLRNLRNLQCQITKCTICQIAMSVCNLHANCNLIGKSTISRQAQYQDRLCRGYSNLIVKSTISRQAKGYSTYMRYRGQGMLRIYIAICAICAICNVKLQNVQFVKLQCQFAICMQIAT